MLGHKARHESLNWLAPTPWHLLEQGDVDACTDIVERILTARGWNTRERRDALDLASVDDLPNPLLLCDMDRACATIERVSAAEAPDILIFGDYDADGLTATALLARYFSARGIDVSCLIPDRFDDGYGLSEAMAEEIALRRPDLVITVDTGTSSPEAIAYLARCGIEVVVTDHHMPPTDFVRGEIPVVNPAIPGERHPWHDFAGAGVALMLTRALDIRRGATVPNREALIVLAMVGTIADVMPVTGCNRAIIAEGLAGFDAHAPAGLKALSTVTTMGGDTLRAEDIAFGIGPRLNAAGRMGDVRLALDLLLEDDAGRAAILAGRLDDLNRERRFVEQATFDEALADVLRRADGRKITVAIAVGDDWHAGVLGIVSARLVERLRVPSFTLTKKDGLLEGSARSFGEINLIEGMDAAASLLDRYGGHKGAAGVELKAARLSAFAGAMEVYVQRIPRTMREAPIDVDLVLERSELSEALVERWDVLEPTGHGFPKPRVWVPRMTIVDVRRVGGGRHLKLTLASDDGLPLDAIWFQHGFEEDFFAAGDRVDALGAVEIHTWRGRRSLQLRVTDIRPADEDRLDRAASDAYRSWVAGAATMTSSDRTPSIAREDIVALWRLMKELAGRYDEPIEFRPTRLAWLLRHRYNGHVGPLEVLLILTILEQAGLCVLADDAAGGYAVDWRDSDHRPKLSETPMWRRLTDEGVLRP